MTDIPNTEFIDMTNNDPDAREALFQWVRENGNKAIVDRIELAEYGVHKAREEAETCQAQKDLARYIKEFAELKKSHEFLKKCYDNKTTQTESIIAHNKQLRRQNGQLNAARYQKI